MEKMKTAIYTLAGAAAIILAAFIISKPWVTIQHTKPILVKGYAEMDVVSDAGSLEATVVGAGFTSAEAYRAAGQSLDKVKALVIENLSPGPEIVELKTTVSEVYKYDENGKRTNEVEYYQAERRIRVSSGDVRGLERLTRMLFDLYNDGISITVDGPDYFVSDLESIKFRLVEEATKNGKSRAELMASSSGQSLGSLVSAQQGVIQITKKNSSETSSWGVYDTETIDKVVKLVVTLEFEID